MKYYSLGLVLAVCACGGGSKDSNNEHVDGVIGVAGGTLTSSDGTVQLTLPAGSVSEDVSVALTKTDDITGAIPGTSYTLTAPSTTLATPAEIAFAAADTGGVPVSSAAIFSPDLIVTPEAPNDFGVRATIAALGNGSVAIADVTPGNPPPPPPPASYYVDPVNGDDAHDGTSQATAFKSLCQAQTVVSAGQTIGLMDGTYSNQGSACTVSFASSVNLQAVNTGAAHWAMRATLAAGGTIDGLFIDGIDFIPGGFTFTGGTAAITNTTYGDIRTSIQGTQPVFVINAATVTITGNGEAFTQNAATNSGYELANVLNGGQLTVTGGSYSDSAAGNTDFICLPLFAMSGASSIVLSGVTIAHKGIIIDANGGTITAQNASSLTNQEHQAQGKCASVMQLVGTTTVTVSNTTLQGGYFGVRAQGTPTISLTNTTISGMSTAGVSLSGQAAFTARASTFTGNGIGLDLLPNPTSTIDLGTAASPGGNTLSGNTSTGVHLSWQPAPASATAVSAAGNTWNANVQGSDASAGTYTAGTTAAGAASGTNYLLGAATDELQF